jgi:hypothetical protein
MTGAVELDVRTGVAGGGLGVAGTDGSVSVGSAIVVSVVSVVEGSAKAGQPDGPAVVDGAKVTARCRCEAGWAMTRPAPAPATNVAAEATARTLGRSQRQARQLKLMPPIFDPVTVRSPRDTCADHTSSV